MIAINSFTKQTFENLKTKYGATSFLSKDFENMKYLGMYVIGDYNTFKKACEQAKTLDTFETFQDSINTINSFLQNNLRSSDYSEELEDINIYAAELCLPAVIPIKDCLKRLQNTIEEINYAIKSVDKYSAKISKTIMPHPLTTSEKIAQIAEVFFANSLIYDDSSSQKLMELMFCCSSDWNGFKEVNALLAENAFTPEGAQQIDSIIDSMTPIHLPL